MQYEIKRMTPQEGLMSYPWEFSYKTSSTVIDGRPVNILHDFYLPALKRIVKYDRVAGYFRSSSLAAASQGFSAFIGNNGKMRLIVGADLEPADVAAILQGDHGRLEHSLLQELDDLKSLPEAVQNGVKLLSYMIAHGYLEVKVSFRRHGVTGGPLSLDSIEDGYVHEKWFVMQDTYGKRLYGSGTLNESKTGLMINAENIDVHCDWWGGRDALRVDDAELSFDKLWNNKVIHMPVLTIPEAVRQHLIAIGEGTKKPIEIDGSIADISILVPDSPSVMERLKFAVLKDAPKMPDGRYVGMVTAPVEPWPHQDIVIRRLIETWPYSYLLCDEVGLGKTIEAGLAIRSLKLSGLVKRVLIAAPAKLTNQWQRELASKALMPFGQTCPGAGLTHEYIYPQEESKLATSVASADLAIVSTGLLARKERRQELNSMNSFDIVLVDEAHYARRKDPGNGANGHPEFGNLYTVIRDCLRKSARSLWLATATPMQIHPVEVSDLIALANRVGAFQYDPTLMQLYYDILGKLLRTHEVDQYEWKFLRKTLMAAKQQDPYLWQFIENSVIDGRVRLTLKQWLERDVQPKGSDKMHLLRVLFSAAPLSRVMLRHTRQLLEVYRENGQLSHNLARRTILPIPFIEFTPLEKQAYKDLEEYCEELTKQLAKQGDSKLRQMTSFLLSFLRLRFASSLFAIKESLIHRLQKVEATLLHQSVSSALASDASPDALNELRYEWDDEDEEEIIQNLLKNRKVADLEWEQDRLKMMIANLKDLSGLTSKMKVLLKVLDERKNTQTGRIHQTVVFTRFRDTLTDILTWLQKVDPHMRIGIYTGPEAKYYDVTRGHLLGTDHEQVKSCFIKGEIDVLLCTDAAAEGLNLQTADLLVNYDLGWNPMKVEQRIGRIDRIGQKHDEIKVLNLCYPGSAEEIVYGRLLKRLSEANLIVGTQQISLLPVTVDDFEELAAGTLSPEELEKRAKGKLQQQRKFSEVMEVSPKDLYDIYMRMRKSQTKRIPVTLSSIWDAFSQSDYLADIGCETIEKDGDNYIIINGIDGVPDGSILTTSRRLLEKGLEQSISRVQFASYGNPNFDIILDYMSAFELPPCIRRIVVNVGITPDSQAKMVGYAIACIDTNGEKVVKSILSYEDIEHLNIAEAEEVTEQEVKTISQQLTQFAEEQFATCRHTSSIELNNLRVALLHEIFIFMVIRELLEVKGKCAGDGVRFATIIREIENMYNEPEKKLLINDLPADVFREFAHELLFECEVPKLGDKANALADHILGKAAIDASKRQVSSMKKRKDSVTVTEAIRKLRMEEASRLKALRKLGLFLE